MKTGRLLLLLIFVSTIAFTSCKKTEDTGTPSTGNGSLSLKHGGSSWNASLAVQGVNTNGVISITGSDSQARQAAVTLFGVSATGTYKISQGSQHSLRWTEGLASEQTYVANGILGTGTIVITELSDSGIKGTFSFNGMNTNGASKSISEGAFDVKF